MKPSTEPSGLEHVHPAGDEVGHIEAAVGADGHAVQYGIVAGHAAKVLPGAVGPQAADMAGVGFVPHDRAVGLDGDPVGENGFAEKSTRRLVLPFGAMEKM